MYDALTDRTARNLFRLGLSTPEKGLLRARVENNWHITSHLLNSEFFTGEQREIVRSIFEGMYTPEWIPKIDQQLKDDAGGFGKDQNIAMFGKPGDDKFEFVMTGRHMTLRCDGNTTEHVAFGGPIFYGHAARGFDEEPTHPGNVFWEQALLANKVYEMLDGKQRKLAEVAKRRANEAVVAFKAPDGHLPRHPVSELSTDQKDQVQTALQKLIEPYRQGDPDEVVKCLKPKAAWTPAPSRSLPTRTSATTRYGTTGDWKVRRSSGTSAARRTSMSG